MLGWILITSLAQGGQRDTALSCAEAKQFFQDDLSVTLTRVCSTLRDCSGVSYTAAQVRIDYFQGQAMSLLLLSSPTTKKDQAASEAHILLGHPMQLQGLFIPPTPQGPSHRTSVMP